MKTGKRTYHVVHVVQSLDVGGMENGIVNLASLIDKDRFSVSICCLSHAGSLAERIKDDRVDIFCMNWESGFTPQLFVTMAREFRARNVDIVHTHGWLSFIYGSVACKLAGISALINGEHGTFNLESTRRKIAYKLLCNVTDKFLTVSYSLKEELKKNLRIPEGKIITIPNGVDSDRFLPGCPAEIADIKSQIGIPATAQVIGTVGRLEHVKNHEMLLRAFCELSYEFPCLHCLLVGDGSLRCSLEKLARELGIQERVHFLGSMDNPQDLIPVFDVFALTSFSEGMSNTILEAMSCAKAIVASDVGGNTELVNDGYNGIIIASGNAEELRNALRTLLKEEVKRNLFGENSRKIIDKKYNISTMISGYEKVYVDTYLQS